MHFFIGSCIGNKHKAQVINLITVLYNFMCDIKILSYLKSYIFLDYKDLVVNILNHYYNTTKIAF